MSDPSAFARAIHTEQWWFDDTALIQEQMDGFRGKKLEDITAVDAAQLCTWVLSEMIHLREVVKAMALEKPRVPRAKRNGVEKPPKELDLSVGANKGLGVVEALGFSLTALQARELGSLLLSAADVIEGDAE